MFTSAKAFDAIGKGRLTEGICKREWLLHGLWPNPKQATKITKDHIKPEDLIESNPAIEDAWRSIDRKRTSREFMVTQWAKHGVYNPRLDAVDYFNLGVLVNQEGKELEENIERACMY
ncbi:hypothetical protein DM860_016446 [Cuscuta australis]|uniref:Uncharacterized protein n=1 Tax=Cuscuta australis TaxID=267555 RepID=A0A328DFX7_9ASTE|nr:hypothetical protein DM860_016446 [Cuscuta australis]